MDRPTERQLGERLFLLITLTFLVAWGFAQIFHGERVPAGDGQGWDGRFYTWLIQDFEGVLLGHKADSYRLQRVLPSAIVRAALSLGGVPAEDRHIVRAFAFLNLAALVGTLLVWNGICRSVDVSIAGRWLGFLLIFVNFACLKTAFYIPEMTDHTALFLGALLVYGYVRGSGALVVTSLALGAFTWPSFLVLGGILLVFPRQPRLQALGPGRRWHWLAAGATALAFLVALGVHLSNPVPYFGLGETVPLDSSLFAVSVPFAFAYVALGFGFLLREPGLFRWETYRRAIDARRVGLWLALLLLVELAISILSSGGPPPQTLGNFLRYQIVQPVMKPALSLLSHLIYLGLLPLVLVFYWRRACEAAHRLGLGFTLFTIALFAQSFTSVSRQILHGMVALTLLAVLAVERLRWPRWAPWLLGGLAFLGSKAWFAINHEGFGGKSHFLSYPAQYLFMNTGLWMSPEMYAVQGSLALAGALLFALVVVRGREMTSEERAQVWPSPHKLLRATLGCGAGLLAALLLEGSARLLLQRQRSPGEEQALTRSDPILGWVNVPGAEGRIRVAGRDVLLRFNAHGLRGPGYDYAKPQGARRILLLGGLLAEASAVPEESSLRARLETRLNGLGCGVFEVLNAGVAGYGLAQQSRFASIEGARYQPDLVLVLFEPASLLGLERSSDPEAEQEAERTALRTPRGLRTPARPPLDPWRGSAALRLLSNLTLGHAPALHRVLAESGLVERTKPPAWIWPFAIRQESQASWESAEQHLRALARDVRSRGARFGVVYGPARFEVDDGEWKALFSRYRMSPRFWRRDRVALRLELAATAGGVPLLDLRDTFSSARQGAAGLYFPRDGSWNEAAHALAADAVAPWVGTLLACAPR